MATAIRLSIFVALGALLIHLLRPPGVPFCRCRPWEHCWPSENDWATLNSSIDGNLISVKPIGRVCHEPTYDPQACEILLNVSRNSAWRAAQPGTLQDWVWDSGSTGEETCYVGGPVDIPCHQGRTPLYSAAVRSVSHVQDAIKFAKDRNLRLAIQNTGHDGSGRSSALGSFEIHTHHLKHTHYHDDFQPVGAATTSGPAVTVGAGVMLGELYAEGARQGHTIVGGVCPTVGLVGGFLQGGGVSGKFSHTRGLAVDNVLEIQAVTADGDLVVANDYHNQDLLWALRGGGGGTFVLVTQATVRIFPDVSCVTTRFEVSAPEGLDEESWTQALTLLLKTLRTFNEQSVAGEVHLRADPLTAMLTLHFLNTTDLDNVDRRLGALFDYFRTRQIPYNYSSEYHALVSSSLRHDPDIYPAEYGITQGSVLVSEHLFKSPQGPYKIAKTLTLVHLQSGDEIFINTLGGAVNANHNSVNASMHPGWRHSALLINLCKSVPRSVEARLHASHELTSVQMPILYSLDPSYKVSYLNMGDPNDPDFRNVYWGTNYDRLLAIKQKWDANALFITRLGVGSEFWDHDGLCRKQGGLWGRIF